MPNPPPSGKDGRPAWETRSDLLLTTLLCTYIITEASIQAEHGKGAGWEILVCDCGKQVADHKRLVLRHLGCSGERTWK